MLVDLHAHYPMHVGPAGSPTGALALWTKAGRDEFMDRLDAAMIEFASRFFNHHSFASGPRVTVDTLRRGNVGVALSVLHTPLLEFGSHLPRRYRRSPPFGRPPQDRYFDAVIRQLEAVERRVASSHQGQARIARSPAELDQVLADGQLALVHCLEGGFSLGATPSAVERSVQELARRGVSYITVAHLIWRQVATNVPALPGVTDEVYNRLFPQPDVGLSELGRAAVTSMLNEGVLIDISHMSDAAMEDTLALMDEVDPGRSVPLIATHTGYRFGQSQYNLSAETVSRIAERDGVIGLILSPHFLGDGLPPPAAAVGDGDIDFLFQHIDEIARLTGSHGHAAIGSDFDGYIKPTLGDLEDSSQLHRLQLALDNRYGAETAGAICSGNALRVLRAGWRGTPSADLSVGSALLDRAE